MSEQATIYILESSLGYYKIGFATDLTKRLLNFSVNLPFNVSVLHTISVDVSRVRYYERWLHRFFANKRLNGEWFILDYFSLYMLVEEIGTEADLENLIWFIDKSGLMEEFLYGGSPANAFINYLAYASSCPDEAPTMADDKRDKWYTDKEFIDLIRHPVTSQ